MSISQTIPKNSGYSVTPSRNNPSTFFTDRETRLAEETVVLPELNEQAYALNTFASQANNLRTEVNTSRDIASAEATNANDAALIAKASANLQGVWTEKGYNAGESVVDSSDEYQMCIVTHTTPKNPVSTTGYWKPTDDTELENFLGLNF